MSTIRKRLTPSEIKAALGDRVPPILTTAEAAELLRVTPKTLNAWKNKGFLEGAFCHRRGEDRYWSDRLIQRYFNAQEWDG